MCREARDCVRACVCVLVGKVKSAVTGTMMDKALHLHEKLLCGEEPFS